MKALIVYESAWGNTKAVAEAIAEGLADEITYELTPVGEALRLDQVEPDVLIVGAPTQAFGLSRQVTRDEAHQRGGQLVEFGVREWLESPSVTLRVATFDTHVRHPNLPGYAGRKAAKKLKKLGCTLIAKPESFFVADYEGPLLDGELDRARSWGQELSSLLRGS